MSQYSKLVGRNGRTSSFKDKSPILERDDYGIFEKRQRFRKFKGTKTQMLDDFMDIFKPDRVSLLSMAFFRYQRPKIIDLLMHTRALGPN